MIYVEDFPLTTTDPSSRGSEIVAFLLEHPKLVEASNRLKETPEKKISFSEDWKEVKYVYVFQREYATVDPSLVEVETSSGSVMPACFDRTSRVPDEIVRRVRVTVSSEDSHWDGKLLETYDTLFDRIVVAPCIWMLDWEEIAFSLQQLSDSEILMRCSTSPAAEASDFVENERRIWSYLIKYTQIGDLLSLVGDHAYLREIFMEDGQGEKNICR